MRKLRRLGLLAAVLCFAAASQNALSQATRWPSHTVRLIVPFAAGGAADVVARTLGQHLSERWGQPVVIDNRPGGNTAIAATETARARPDGYTLFQAINSTLTVNQFTFGKLPYDVARDFTPVALVATVPIVLLAGEKLPAKNVADLVAKARANPGKITVGGGSVGIQLAVERFSRDAKVQFQYVPYKSGVEVTRALLSGEVDLAMDAVGANVPYIKSGKVRVLATNDPQRMTQYPDVPTLAELGFKNSEAGLWHAILAPAGLPHDVQAKISEDLRAVLELPDVKERFVSLGIEGRWGGPDRVVEAIRVESSKFGPLIKELGIRME